jgi:hypothetical protein
VNTVFLFGAGASAFSLDCVPGAPPLGNGLFGRLRRQGGLAATLSGELAGVFNRNFEEGVERLWSTRPVDLSALLRDTARYLAQFEPGPSNLYRQLARFLIDARKSATLATINYDLLIELAVCAEGGHVTYHGLPVPLGNLPVLKLHGSCNFLPDVSIRGIGFDVGRGSSIVGGAPIRVAKSSREVIEWCKREDAIAPVLALYAKGKPVLYCPEFVQEQQRHWCRAVGEAKRVYVIGVRVNPDDRHVWDILERSRAGIFYVGPEGDAVSDWATQRGRRDVHHFAPTFKEAVTSLLRDG